MLDRSLSRQWVSALKRQPESARRGWLVSWLHAGFEVAVRLRDLSEDHRAFAPFSGYITELGDVPYFIRDLVANFVADVELTVLLRDALAELPARISFDATEEDEEIMAAMILDAIGIAGIYEAIPMLLVNKREELHGASPKIVSALIGMANDLRSHGDGLLRTLSEAPSLISPSRTKVSFVFVLAISEIKLTVDKSPLVQEVKLLGVLKRYQRALGCYPNAFEFRAQLTTHVVQHIPEPCSIQTMREIARMSEPPQEILDHEVLLRSGKLHTLYELFVVQCETIVDTIADDESLFS